MAVIKNIPYKGIYREAFWQGYNHAFGDESWGFGKHSEKEDFKHIPKGVKDKNKWLEAWHDGCGIGCE